MLHCRFSVTVFKEMFSSASLSDSVIVVCVMWVFSLCIVVSRMFPHLTTPPSFLTSFLHTFSCSLYLG